MLTHTEKKHFADDTQILSLQIWKLMERIATAQGVQLSWKEPGPIKDLYAIYLQLIQVEANFKRS